MSLPTWTRHPYLYYGLFVFYCTSFFNFSISRQCSHWCSWSLAPLVSFMFWNSTRFLMLALCCNIPNKEKWTGSYGSLGSCWFCMCLRLVIYVAHFCMMSKQKKSLLTWKYSTNFAWWASQKNLCACCNLAQMQKPSAGTFCWICCLASRSSNPWGGFLPKLHWCPSKSGTWETECFFNVSSGRAVSTLG